MSPELVGAFERQWPDVAKRLEKLLAAKNVPICKRDDVVQETGLRLFGMWEKVDRARPVWPLVVTIALNLLRDEARRNPEREVLGAVPDVPTVHDVEHEGLARIELERVQEALAQLSPSHREVLLNEITPTVEVPKESRNATKMMRLRARRALATLLETAALRAAVAGLKIRRSLGTNDPLLPLRIGGGEASAASAAALALAALLFGSMQIQPPSVAHAAESPRPNLIAPTDANATVSVDASAEQTQLVGAVRAMRESALTDGVRTGRRGDGDRNENDRDRNGKKRRLGPGWGAPPPDEAAPIEVPLPVGEAYVGGSTGAGAVGAVIGYKEGNPSPACVAGVEPGSIGCGTAPPQKTSVTVGAKAEAGGQKVQAEVDEEIDATDLT